jgi:putative acetyltransferase
MLTIRKFQHGDESELRDIFFNTVRKVNSKDYSEVQVNAWAPVEYDQAAWQQRIRAINPFVAMLNSDIVGYADIQDDGYVDHFFCHWNYQGKGVGKALMHALITAGQQKGLARFYAHVSITAKPFFEHFGFKVVKRQQVEIRGHTLTNYVMEKLV